jgi:Kef-type K+ transport system membrane component KefB
MLPTDLLYVALLFVLFVVPRFLQRYRIPGAITSLLLGVGAASLGVLSHDPTIELLSTFGIVALFLFAGLDVDLEELRPDLRILLQHLAIWSLTLGGVAWLVVWWTGIGVASALLVALGLVTPSTGFILDSLDRFGLTPDERRWTKAKAIAVELLALLVLFGVMQSSSARQFAVSSGVLIGLIVILPPLFRWFAERIAPHAPRSEFAFLLMVAVVCATVTRRLGVYYLVGAFVVGLAARQFRSRLPAMSSERMLHAVEAFASFFVPFYFFHAGQGVDAAALDQTALLVGLVCLAGSVVVRLGETALHRWLALREPPRTSLRIGVAMLPTLVFTLVLVGILRERPEVPVSLVNGMVIFTVLITMIPGIVLRLPTVEYDLPQLDEVVTESTPER